MAIKLNEEDQELLREEVAAFGGDVPEGEVRERYARLARAVDEGDLPDDVLTTLGILLELGLQSGQARQRHRAAAEQRLLRLFGQTPAGKARAATITDVNAALAQLQEQQIETVRVHARRPGDYLLLISTDACEITLRFSAEGAGVESVAVGV